MKTLTKTKIATMVLLLVLSIGCSKKSSTMNVPGPGNPDAVPQNPGTATCGAGVTYASGATATLTLPDVSFDSSLGIYRSQIFEKYAGRLVNLGCLNPAINVNMDTFNVQDPGHTPQYGGLFKIGRVENGNSVIGTFSSGTSIDETKFNKWYSTGGAQKLKLFFQDTSGGVIVILKQVVINDMSVTYQGDVYFRNFDFGVCANPPPWGSPQCNVQSPYKKCWDISAGPYSCRAFLSGNNVRPDIIDLPGFGDHQSGYTGPGYLKLGTFVGMDANLATGG